MFARRKRLVALALTVLTAPAAFALEPASANIDELAPISEALGWDEGPVSPVVTRSTRPTKWLADDTPAVHGIVDLNHVSPASYLEPRPSLCGDEVACCDRIADLPAPAEATAGLFGSTTYLYLRPTLRGLDYAVSDSGSALTLGRGDVRELSLNSDSGFRTAIGYQTSAGWSLAGRYTMVDFQGSDATTRPGGSGQLLSTRSHPDGNEEADTAAAHGALDYRVFDLEAAKPIMRGSFATMRVFGGVRWADVRVSNRFDYDGRDFVHGQILQSMQAEGVGLQMGSDCTWKLAGGFGIVGRASGGLMRGNFRTQHYETNLNQAVTLVDVQDDFHQAVPNVELSSGLTWTRRGLTLSCTYELINWFNAYDRAMFVDDIHEATYGPFAKDLLLDGVGFTLQYCR